jgi:LysM repeat protein
MWVFTEIADWFDKTRHENEKFVDSELQPWVATTLYEDHSWYRNVGVWTAAGTLYALNKFTTTVAAGFVDVLRLGDGVQEGGWGYGKDALRLLMVVGPALRGARYVIAGIQELDIGQAALNQTLQQGASFADALRAVPWAGNCGWVAAARILRQTGTGVFAELSDVARAAGMDVADTGGLSSVTDLDAPLRFLGASTKTAQINGMKGLADLVSKNPYGAVMFGVRWIRNGVAQGHALVAFRNFFGGISILDRSGKVFATLADLPYKGIANGVIDIDALVVNNSLAITSLENVPTVANILTQSASNSARIPESKTSGASSQNSATARPQSSASASSASGSVTPGTLIVTTNTICIQPNSDMPVSCSPVQTRSYKVGAGESLSIIAHRVYGDASKWPAIAAVNGIKPPRYVILPGQTLILP